MGETKRCTNCGEEKPATREFFSPVAKGDRFGLRAWCKPCSSAAACAYRADMSPAERRAFDKKHSERYWRRHAPAIKERARLRYAADPEYRAQAKARALIAAKAHRERDPDGFREYHNIAARDGHRRRRADPARNADWNRKKRAWNKANWDRVSRYRGKGPEAAAERLAAKLQAIPAWANKNAIRALYEDARQMTERTGAPYHVDHIIPLRGRNVCGLHVETNLRVVPATVNLQKANKLILELC